ncbi:Cdc4 and related F-box and WD-40 proteins [Phaffia rhodozyma]|uniref:Cdc4 and related F-box and WD-40 proteins n=1 Tax=Phaffia rhodozyma TaxID=264483 RepID=A0A0F7SEV4_PHARH|nr:Cdc4 and related F-box and WD-40 proteins [Phaffia rhodozyma]
MQTTNSDNLFKSDAQMAKEAGREEKLVRTQALGDPIKLTSKPLGILIKGDEVWAAESGFILRRLSLITGKSSIVYKGHTAPVTCLALYDLPSSSDALIRRFLLSGSWDKTIKVWDRDTGICLSTTSVHTDFVKCLLPLPSLSTPLLLSGSSDKSIRVLSLASLASSPSSSLEQMQSLQEHTRPIKRLVSVPQVERDHVEAYSADSMGRVILWSLKINDHGGLDVKEKHRWSAHETSVTDLWVEEDGVWTASMDTFIHYHPFSSSSSSLPIKIVFPQPSIHPQPAPHALLPLFHLTPPILLTGSADEFIRVWDLSAGEASGQARLVHTIEGHCADVTGLARWVKDREEWVVSWALDGTVRRWRLKNLLNPPPPAQPDEGEKDGLTGGMTEEEARELAELMSDEE